MSNDEILSRLSKAGALVGISNAAWWSRLVSDHGEPCVLAIVDAITADTRQAVNVAVVASRCRDDAQRKQDAADDAAEDAAAEAAPMPTPGAKPALAQAPRELANQEKDMTTIKQVLKNVEDEIKRRGITAKAAQEEIGVSGTTIYAWRKGDMSASAANKIAHWLPESAKRQPTSGLAEAETVALEKKPKRTAPAVSQIAIVSVDSAAGELLTQGANLADALRALGASGYADVVAALVQRLRTVRAALSA